MIGDALLEALRLLAAFDPYVFEILYRSIRVSGGALFLAVLTGLPAGVLLGLARFPGRRFLVALVYTGFALPPVVVGLVVYLVLSNQGPAGSLELLFSPSAIVIAQALLAAPYVTGVSLAAIQAVPPDVRLQARALGASRAVISPSRVLASANSDSTPARSAEVHISAAKGQERLTGAIVSSSSAIRD